MRIDDIMSKKGIEITDENQIHPAKDGAPRWGLIRKEMRLYSPSCWMTCKATYATVGIEVNTRERTIEVQFLKGSMPYAENLFLALLADRDVRRLIEEYQRSTRTRKYKIWSTEGMSGRKDIFMSFAYKYANFAVTKTIKLCHISGYGRLNEGFGNELSRMYIGDFVELVAYMGLVDGSDDMKVRSLRKRAGVKYIRPKFAEEVADFEATVTKLL